LKRSAEDVNAAGTLFTTQNLTSIMWTKRLKSALYSLIEAGKRWLLKLQSVLCFALTATGFIIISKGT